MENVLAQNGPWLDETDKLVLLYHWQGIDSPINWPADDAAVVFEHRHGYYAACLRDLATLVPLAVAYLS